MLKLQRVNPLALATLLVLMGVHLIVPRPGESAAMNDYCIQPPFISQVVPPLVMFVMDKEHRLFTEAYSDSFDLDGDGKIETGYKHTIEYYGYFDANKCYTYSGTANAFQPANYSAQTGTDAAGKPLFNRFCTNGQWSGNILNWLTMSRMDVLKKVLYGGQRTNPDSTTKTTLQRVYIPQDAHSFGKEFTGRLCFDGSASYTNMCSGNGDCENGFTCQDKSLQLIGIGAPPATNNCSYTSDIVSTPANGKILVAAYNHSASATLDQEIGASHQNILDSFVPGNFVKSYYITDFNVDDTSAANNDLIPTQSHGNNNSLIAVAEFNVAQKTTGSGRYDYSGTWQFVLDSDDGAELYIDGSPVASYYSVSGTNGHSSCATAPTTLCVASQQGSITLSAGYHTLIVRMTNYLGNSGTRVWYKRPGDSAWIVFGTATASAGSVSPPGTLSLRSPIIPGATANCTMMTNNFITTGVPTKGVLPGYHLFCNKSTTGNNSYGPPLLRMLTNRTERIWDWISREVVQCGDTLGSGTAVAPTEYQVNIEVCNSTVGLEPNCKQYGTGNSATRKPVGLLQKYGDADGTKICSKTFAKGCNNDADCRPGSNNGTDLGMCVDRSRMYFGLLTGSYNHNLQGGVLRKNIISISDEVDIGNGFFKTAENIPSNMLETFDKLQITDYSDSTTNYANCVAQNQIISDGKCSVWGNPLAEMLYETLRYYSGKGTPNTDYDYPQNQMDGGLNLPHPAYWGYKDGNTRVFKGPYDIFPSCSKPFVILLSDVYPSFDADKLPGVTNSTYTEDTNNHPVLGLDRTVNGKKFLSKLLDDIASTESLTNSSFFVGDNGTTYDFICTPKTASTLSLLRGLCPEQPTRKGSFYTAALAYYAHSFMNAEIKKDTTAGINTKIPNAQTFAVALASQVGNWSVKAGTNLVRIVPFGKSVSGAVNMDATCKNKCTLGTTNFTDNTFKTMTISNCAADAYCPTNEIVKVYTQSIKYDASGNPVYLSFRINFADSEQGADYDMDAVGWFEVCTQAAKDAGYGTCGTDMNSNQVEIKVVSDYAAGGIDQVLGFILSGTTEDGSYLVVRDKSVTAGTSLPNSLPFNWSHVFTVTGSSTGVLKDPLWYAAKWGGFQDKNGNNIPDQKSEWAQNCTETDISKCYPDNYYLVVNPLKLELQLERAFSDIVSRVSSGTAASILNNSEGSGASLLQAVFYPKKSFDNGTEANWIGEMQNLWYYLDPFFNKSTVRVDTNGDYSLDLKDDYIAKYHFDNSQSQTVVDLAQDVKGDGSNLIGKGTYFPDDPNVRSLWKAGRKLWERNVTSAGDPRSIFTVTAASAGSSLSAFKNDGTFNSNINVISLLQATDSVEAGKIIDYTHGIDQAGYRSRKVTILNCAQSDGQGCTREWKLGDIINSTPKLESTVELNSYSQNPPGGYGDASYGSFVSSTNYKKRGMAFAGGNDGLLHAFKLGILDVSGQTASHKARILNADGSNATSSSNLGREEWAFIPRNALPYLRYMTDPAYAHLYSVDNAITLVDASINAPVDNDNSAFPGCNATNYHLCGKKTTKNTDGSLDMDKTSWRTILIGGMGFGGASKNLYKADGVTLNDTCTDKSSAGTCVKTPMDKVGYSAYFALDVTNPHVLPPASGTDSNAIKFLWEFNGSGQLGYSTTGPAIVRVGARDKNGKWFAVFASGPTGPIDTTSHSFLGKSDQNLKIFVVDLATGSLLATFDSGLTNAFAGSLASSVIDTDKSNSTLAGNYSDDAIYIGYVQLDSNSNTYSKGGVLRLVTKENTDPGQWALSTVISGIGPVTTSVTKLQDRNVAYDKSKPPAAKGKLWLFFGTGRYYYKTDALDNAFTLYGIQEPCYSNNSGHPNFTSLGPTNDIDASCAKTTTTSDLQDQSGSASAAPATTLTLNKAGWFVSLDTSALNDGFSSERVITNPVASPSGAVLFTTFRPTSDICGYGGNSYIWAVRYDTGAEPPAAAMKGKALMQVSTGELAERDLSDAFRNPKTGVTNPSGPSDYDQRYDKRRINTPIAGMPPAANGLTLISSPRPAKKILHYKEK